MDMDAELWGEAGIEWAIGRVCGEGNSISMTMAISIWKAGGGGLVFRDSADRGSAKTCLQSREEFLLLGNRLQGA